MDYKIIAKEVIKNYPKAKAVFICGSHTKGLATKTSDIDLQIVYSSKDLAKPFRHSYLYNGVPIETFHNNELSLKFWLKKEIAAGKGATIFMIGEGVSLIKGGYSKKLQKQMMDIIKKGPKKLEKSQIDAFRYSLTDLLDDISSPKNASDFYASLNRLYLILADFYLRLNGMWSGYGKPLLRILEKQDNTMYQKYIKAFHKAFKRKNPKLVIKLTDEILELAGGRFWDGYKTVADIDFHKN